MIPDHLRTLATEVLVETQKREPYLLTADTLHIPDGEWTFTWKVETGTPRLTCARRFVMIGSRRVEQILNA